MAPNARPTGGQRGSPYCSCGVKRTIGALEDVDSSLLQNVPEPGALALAGFAGVCFGLNEMQRRF